MLPEIEWLSNEEEKAIALNFARTRGERGFTEEELSGVLNEFIKTRAEAALLDHVLRGNLRCDWDGSKILLALAEKHVVKQKN